MGVFSLHFMYDALNNVTGIFFLSVAQLAHTHVSHALRWHACAYSVHNNSTLYKIEYLL